MCEAGCADKRRQRSTDTKMAVGQRIGLVQACERGRLGGRLPPACMLAGSPPQNSPGLRCRAGREQAGGPGREQAACPPACTGCVWGLDTHVPPTTAAHTRLPGQALGHSLPASLLPLLPQSFSFGSTDGIRTRPSQGPSPPLQSWILIHGSQLQIRFWLWPLPPHWAQPLSSSTLKSFFLSRNPALGGP